MAIQLNELEEDRILIKEKAESNPLNTKYMLSEDGMQLCSTIKQMEEWGIRYKLYTVQQAFA